MSQSHARSGLSIPHFGVAVRLGLIATLLSRGLLASQELETAVEPVIYGADTRQEARLHPNARFRDLARKSTLALIPKDRLSLAGDSVEFAAPTFAEANELCEDEPFQDQPVLAECSGVLVAPDLVLTAGHCIEDQSECERTAFVLDFTLDEGGRVRIPAENVFDCQELVSQELTHVGKPVLFDHALVRLEAPGALAGQPVTVRNSPVDLTEPLALIGTSLGLPVKIDSAGTVVDPGGTELDYFAAQFDLFHRGSGSPVFDARGNLLGVGVRGGVDFDGEETCVRLRTVPENSTYAEEASYAGTALLRSVSPTDVQWAEVEADSPNALSPDRGVPASCAFRSGSVGRGVPTALLWLLTLYCGRRRRARRFDRFGVGNSLGPVLTGRSQGHEHT